VSADQFVGGCADTLQIPIQDPPVRCRQNSLSADEPTKDRKREKNDD